MGLDQYAYTRDREGNSEKQTELAYWRKHNRLQGWMEWLWFHKGNRGKFNCDEVELTPEDIDLLEKTITNKELPKTEGFFFGSDSYKDYEQCDLPTDLKFIEDAREAFENGKRVFYNSWW